MVHCTYLSHQRQYSIVGLGKDEKPTNHVWAIVLVIRKAVLALHTTLDLGSNANTFAGLELRDRLADSQDFANDFVANTEGSDREVSPAASDSMDIGSADPATFVLDIDVVILEDFGSKLRALSELVP